jgi:hypothetical protein
MLALELEKTAQLPRLPLAKTVIRTGMDYSIIGFGKANKVLNWQATRKRTRKTLTASEKDSNFLASF